MPFRKPSFYSLLGSMLNLGGVHISTSHSKGSKVVHVKRLELHNAQAPARWIWRVPAGVGRLHG